MSEAARYPVRVSVYEAVRTHPGSMQRLGSYGVTRDLYDLTLRDAALQLHVPLEELTGALVRAAAPSQGAPLP